MASFTIHIVEKRRLILLGVYKVNEKKGKILGRRTNLNEHNKKVILHLHKKGTGIKKLAKLFKASPNTIRTFLKKVA